ncbi:MAG TPA: hypothetical protein VHM94_08765 [Acidimicrobiia bacterium]|nr:hypothetical protein [Acidimicrobiia bacterium]
MRLTIRDAMATVFVLVAAALYALWANGMAMQGLTTRVLGMIVIGLGMAGCMANQREMAVVYWVDRDRPHPPMPYVVAASVIGGLALVAGIITLAAASQMMLSIVVGATVVLWAMSTVRHWMAGGPNEARTSAPERTLQKAA